MTCESFKTRDGVTHIICHGRGRRVKPKPCSVCSKQPGTLECDGPNPKRKSGTCDALLCEACTFRDENVHVGSRIIDTHDLCPKCALAAKVAKRAPIQGRLF